MRGPEGSDDGRTSVTVIGLGAMGRALAGAFLRAGHPTTVWNRSPEKAGELVAQGAALADSVTTAVTASPLTVVCVTDTAAVRGLLDPVRDSLDGRTLVNLSSGTSAQARETAAWAARHGAAYLDGAIMAVPAEVGAAGVTVVFSGPLPAFATYEPTLRSLGGETAHLGDDHGLTALHEVAALSLMWSMLNGYLQGAALLKAAGVDAVAFTPIARKGIESTAGWLPGFARQIDDGAYSEPESTLDTHLAAMEHVVEESRCLGVSAELPRFLKALAERAVADGHGGSGYAAMVEQFRAPLGRPLEGRA
ncbi:NAD(P)-dependent oxidoreductase [Streptomyces sp. NPDC048172]|uniref:NAD(P)-dependent oxidoreductase n=1 Tax=Streptomyces sp. NPDC048172 TaxID=3365505 RepID=UPI003715CCDD